MISSFRFILVLALALNACLAKAQDYSLSWEREAWIGGAALTLAAGDLYFSSRLQPLSPQDVSMIAPQQIWRLDRSATTRFSPAAARRSDFALIGASVAALAVSGILAHKNADPITLGALWFETNLLVVSGTQVFKSGLGRNRPYAYNPLVDTGLKLEKDARKSFFSGHTSIAAANSFFAASVFSYHYPQSKWKPLVWTAAIVLPAWVGLERYQAGKHFPTDVLAGYAFGALCGWLTPRLHRKR